MKSLITFFVNSVVILLVISASFAVATFALSKKIDDRNKFANKIYGVVEKKESVVISKTRGNIEEIYFSSGDEIKKGDKIAKLINPDIENKIETLSKVKDNESAATELELAKKEANGLDVLAPVNGYIDEVSKSEGEFVNPSDRMFVIFSNEDTRVLFYFFDYEYRVLSNINKFIAYSNRLDQYINLRKSNLKPKTQKNSQNQNKIGLYFTLTNPADGEKLLQGEDIVLNINSEEASMQSPLDFLKETWLSFINK